MIAQEKLDEIVENQLNALYKKRFTALEKINLERLFKKNPYLFRSIGMADSSELVSSMLDAFISSSDETIFGNDFFEPVALWTAKNADVPSEREWIVTVGSAAGTDLSIETKDAYMAIAVKSGTNIFNSQSSKGQLAEFGELQARLRKIGKEIRQIVGYGYGRHKAKKTSKTEKHAGQAFWALLSGEKDFYLRISDSIGKYSANHKLAYEQVYAKAKNRILKQMVVNFVDESGCLDWRKIVEFNSSETRPKSLKVEEDK